VGTESVIDPESYCRDIEAYLCRKNDGHLIRIVGPAFEHVSRWASQGIPLKVTFTGIDRYFERYYRKGARRRPVRIEFCEADVLDAFDDWRRAVGVALPVAGAGNASGHQSDDGEAPSATRRRPSLALHIERVIAQLTVLRAQSQAADVLQDMLEHVARELDTVDARAKRLRGEAREQVLSHLQALDRMLLSGAVASLDEVARAAAEAEAKSELRPFRDRMVPEAYQRACAAAVEAYVRAHYGLPTIKFE